MDIVSWLDAKYFIKLLNKKTGRHYRLPTEAEWEYACRSGGQDQKYCGGDNVDELAWYSENTKPDYEVKPGKGKRPNGLGFYDMSGNVFEYTCSEDSSGINDGSELRCSDKLESRCATYLKMLSGDFPSCYDKHGVYVAYKELPNPISRGGGARNTEGALRSTYRYPWGLGSSYGHNGFRLAED